MKITVASLESIMKAVDDIDVRKEGYTDDIHRASLKLWNAAYDLQQKLIANHRKNG